MPMPTQTSTWRLVPIVILLLSLALLPKTDVVQAAPAPGPAAQLDTTLSITKTAYPESNVAYHGTVTYTVALANSGATDLAGVQVTDTLPLSTTFATWAEQPPGAGVGDPGEGQEVTWNGTVMAGQAITLSFAVTHSGDYGDVVTNTARYGTISGTASAQAAFVVRSDAALSIAKVADPQQDVPLHGTVTYSVTLANDGDTDAAGVVLTDTLPVSTTFAHWVEQPGGANLDGNQITWEGTVGVGQAVTLAFAVAHSGEYGDVVTNRATYRHLDETDSAQATFAVQSGPVLAIAKAASPPENVPYHGTVTYTVALANDGDTDAQDVHMTDSLPLSTTFQTWVEQPPGANVSADLVTWDGTVEAGQAITFAFAVAHTGDYGDVVTNTAYVHYLDQTDSAEATFSVVGVYTTYLPTVLTPPPYPAFYAYALQAHGEHRLPNIVHSARDLDMAWVKQQVRWEQIEGTQGDYGFAGLDAIADAYNTAGFKVLFSVAAAPDWTRPGKPGDGPPDDYAHFDTFMRDLATHFRGRVHAYEIWNEPNLKREWDGVPLSPEDYVRLLEGGYRAVKAVDPDAIVVSAGPNPTGVNDGILAIDDRMYLRRMYVAGLRHVCDAVGVHPYGFANPPDVLYTGGDYDPDRGFDDHPSFFFRNTMEDYYRIMAANNDGDKRLWATEFGWGTVDGMFVPPNPGLEYTADINEGQQADYIVRAFQWSHDWGHAGVMFLWNLNYWAAAGPYSEMAKYSILRADWSPRQAYVAVRDMPR